MRNRQVDNSMPWAKGELRKRYLPDDAKVLDLFCGSGEMYRRAYQGRVTSYLGLDKEKIHDERLCVLTDNERWVRRHSLDVYNVFDLDAYGCPWKLLYLVLGKRSAGEVTMFVTDGMAERMMMSGHIAKMVSATERVPKNFMLPGLLRWYPDIFATMLLDVERRYGWRTTAAVYFHNPRRTVYYWAIRLEKLVPGVSERHLTLVKQLYKDA